VIRHFHARLMVWSLASEVKNMEILKETIGGVQVGTLVVGMAIILSIVWLWSRWDERKARKRRAKRAEYQAATQDDARVRARVMEEAKRVLHETRRPATSANDDLKKSHLELSRMSNETLARDLYISTQMQLRFPKLRSGAYPRSSRRGDMEARLQH
jgi:hypothetical protein